MERRQTRVRGYHEGSGPWPKDPRGLIRDFFLDRPAFPAWTPRRQTASLTSSTEGRSKRTLNGVWGTSSANAYAVGAANTLLHYVP